MSASFKAQIQCLLASLDLSCCHSLCFGNTALEWSNTEAKACSVSWRLNTLKGGVLSRNYFLLPCIFASEQQEETSFFLFLLLALVWELFSHLF